MILASTSIGYILEDVFLPISIVVILPVLIVWLITRVRVNRDNKRTEVLTEAIKNNANVDTDKLIEAMQQPRKTPGQELRSYLLKGSIFSLIGLMGGVAYFIPGIGGESYLMLGGLLFLAIGIGYLIAFFYGRSTSCGQSDGK